jgi:DMSO/TMAO reductase YedYZ molybdopterin-dependent catalytic subunit
MTIETPLPPEVDGAAPRAAPPPMPSLAGPVAGVAAAAFGVGLGQLIAALADSVTPLDAAGTAFIDRTPQWLKQWAIDTFGTDNKTALRIGMVITIALLAAVAGVVARRRLHVAMAVFAIAGVANLVTCLRHPGATLSAGMAPLLATLAGGAALWVTTRTITGRDPLPLPQRSKAPLEWDRRRFIRFTSVTAATGLVAAASGRRVESSRAQDAFESAPSSLPEPVLRATPIADGDTTLSPVTPFITPNDNFYRIDTALSLPRIDAASWTLDIRGKVSRPLRLTYDDLLARPQVERTITICCVSNEVGGDLVGNAVWQGVLLADVLAEAGIDEGAEQVFSTSEDGWTCGFPVQAALDGRDALIAIGMNGEPLPQQHGFPARLIIPGLYGYVSATKWLTSIDLTTWDAEEGYWIPRGWSREAPVKTQSRIDVPRRGDRVLPGPTIIAGVAWAQQRGIASVEVRVDGGEWRSATLGTDVSIDTWRQWRIEWEATPGTHVVQVRATDGNGDTQTEEVSRPDPDGATGWHTREVSVDDAEG